MAQAIKRSERMVREQVFEIRYEKRSWLIFSWYRKISSEKVRDDLHLFFDEHNSIDKIYFYNGIGSVGIELTPKQN